MDRILKAARTFGSLNLSNRSLRDVPNEVYKNFEEAGEGDKWWELKEDLWNLPLLTVISHNKLSELPTAIGELHMLKSLDVSFNLIVKIPEENGSSTALVK